MRRTRLLRACLVALISCSLALPAPAQAAQDPKKLAAQLKELNSSFEVAGQAYSSAYWKLDKTEARIGKLDKRLTKTQKRMRRYQKTLRKRAEAMYRQDDVDFVSFVLSANTFDEMINRMEFFSRIAERDAGVIRDSKRLRRQYIRQKRELAEVRKERKAEVDSLRRRRDRLQEQLASKKAEYDKVKAALEAAQAAEEAAAKREKRAATRYTPSGPMGMVFPVAGPCSYTDTWGAARSGGRSHQGTDIMASKGTPCVATLSGTVRSSSSGLGGMTIWLSGSNGWAFYYAHLSGYKRSSGHVSKGEVIGYVGNTGNARYTSPHLHYEIHPGGGAAVNPYPYLRQMQ